MACISQSDHVLMVFCRLTENSDSVYVLFAYIYRVFFTSIYTDPT